MKQRVTMYKWLNKIDNIGANYVFKIGTYNAVKLIDQITQKDTYSISTTIK